MSNVGIGSDTSAGPEYADGSRQMVLSTGVLVYNNDVLGNVTSKVLPTGTLVAGHSYRWDVRSSVNGVFSPYSADYYFRVQ